MVSERPLAIAGVVLLLAGWFVSVTAQTPWQAIAVSGLGLWLLVARLWQRWQVQDLTAIFLVGLQLVWLLWRLIPPELRQNLITVANRIAGTTFMPWSLVGVVLFPYVVLTLFFSARLRRWQQADREVSRLLDRGQRCAPGASRCHRRPSLGPRLSLRFLQSSY